MRRRARTRIVLEIEDVARRLTSEEINRIIALVRGASPRATVAVVSTSTNL